MKLTLIAALSVLSTLVSGLALPDLARRGSTIYPDICIVIKEEFPDTPFPPNPICEVSRKNGSKNVKTLLGFTIPPCTGSCTVRFNDALPTPTGSRRMQFFTSGRYPVDGDTWNKKPFTNNHIGTFVTTDAGPGPATVVEDFGLTFPCPATTTKYGFEVQPVWDNVFVSWDCTKAGYFITCT